MITANTGGMFTKYPITDIRCIYNCIFITFIRKTLVVLEFCVIFGSEAIASYAKDSIYTIKTLKEFIHIDEKGRDKGILGNSRVLFIIVMLCVCSEGEIKGFGGIIE